MQYRVGQDTIVGRASVLPLVDDAKLQVVASLSDKDDHVYSVDITDKVLAGTRSVTVWTCVGS